MQHMKKVLLPLLAAHTIAPAIAQPQLDVADAGEEELKSEIDTLKAREAEANARADALEARIAELERLLGARSDNADMAEIRGRAMPQLKGVRVADTIIPMREEMSGSTAQALSMQGNAVQGAGADRKSAAPTTAVEDVARKEQGYFGNRFTIEPSFTYTHFDDARINLSGFLALDSIFLGRISIDDVSADIFTLDLTGRYSVSPRLQFDANVPLLYRRSSFASGGAGGNSEGVTEVGRTGRGLGDVSMGASYRVLQETNSTPDLVLNARVKAPTGRHPFGVELLEVPGSEGNLTVPERLSTGSGVWGASVGLSALKTIDPMVVYGSVSYFRNFARDFADIDEAPGDQPGRARLGQAFQFGAGVAFALNERSSLNLGYTQRLVERTRIRRDEEGWRTVAGSQANVALMNIGATFALNPRTTLITNVGIGLTDDAPNMVVSLRFPFRM